MIDKRLSRRTFLTISAMTAAFLALDWKKIQACAASMGDKNQYSTVIIGAGLGGLCCGAYLSRFGIPVTVVEQHGIPGGYATSFNRGNFTFEVSLHGTSIDNNAGERILKDLGVLKDLQLVSLPEAFHFKTSTLDISVPQRDPGALIHLLAKHFPSGKEGIRGFIQEIIGIAEETDKLHRKKGKFFKYFFPFNTGRCGRLGIKLWMIY